LDDDAEPFEGGLASDLVVRAVVRIRAETESVLDNGVHRVGGQSELGPVRAASQ